jgi:squalene synthase HpnC
MIQKAPLTLLPGQYASSSTIDEKEAEAYCRNLAKTHYENFTVGSWFIPKKLRQHMYNIYAYCRWSDDLGDEVVDRKYAFKLLEEWEKALDDCYKGKATHPIFAALQKTIREFDIPKDPFWRLIQAFKQDQIKTRYATFQELLGYCVNSANPVGHLVLYLFGYRDQRLFQLSDFTCTALQLANFWQDVARDFKIGRIYIPQEDMARFGVSEEEIQQGNATLQFKKMMAFEVERTRELFHKGLPLVKQVKEKLLKIDLHAFSLGGLAVLRGIEAIDYNVLSKRPVVSRTAKAKILLQSFLKAFIL